MSDWTIRIPEGVEKEIKRIAALYNVAPEFVVKNILKLALLACWVESNPDWSVVLKHGDNDMEAISLIKQDGVQEAQS